MGNKGKLHAIFLGILLLAQLVGLCKFLLDLANTVILGSKSLANHGHMLTVSLSGNHVTLRSLMLVLLCTEGIPVVPLLRVHLI
jgi:hypothetical protein